MIEEELRKYPVRIDFEVLWGQMDSAKHVNNTIYLRWAESARIAYFEAMEMDTSFAGGGVGPILGWLDCKYIFPLTYPDTALCGAKVIEIRKDRFIMECAIFSKKNNRIAAISKQSVVPYSYEKLQKVEMPNEWITQIQSIEKE